MDFTLLKSFIAVAEEKSFSAAAKNLFISQQTLSKQVAKLEEDLGTTLFIRSRPLALTPDGGQLLPIAKEILLLKQQFEESSSKSFSGAHFIHLGIEHTIARAILPRILPQFLKEHPDTFVRLSEESPNVMQKSISYDGVDLVIGSLGSVPEKFEAIPLCRKEHLLVVPKEIMRRPRAVELSQVLRRQPQIRLRADEHRKRLPARQFRRRRVHLRQGLLGHALARGAGGLPEEHLALPAALPAGYRGRLRLL